MASDTILFGVASEPLVMAELLRRGFTASLAPAGTANADIVETDVEGNRVSPSK